MRDGYKDYGQWQLCGGRRREGFLLDSCCLTVGISQCCVVFLFVCPSEKLYIYAVYCFNDDFFICTIYHCVLFVYLLKTFLSDEAYRQSWLRCL